MPSHPSSSNVRQWLAKAARSTERSAFSGVAAAQNTPRGDESEVMAAPVRAADFKPDSEAPLYSFV
jgi:hypothetical protein